MFFEFFVFWGVWWWLLVAALIFIDILCLENDYGFGATVSLIVFGVAMFFFSSWDSPFSWIAANPLWTIGVVLGYFVAGTVWSVMKWYFHCLNVRDEYNETKVKFFQKHNITGDTIPGRLKSAWKDEFHYFRKGIPPKALKHKSDILMWMTHWPFSALWTLLNDPIRRIFISIYSHLSGGLQLMSNRIFSTSLVTFDDD